jgi:hypothetical protein
MSATTPRPQWTDIENYRQRLREYERLSGDYAKALASYRKKQAKGEDDADLKAKLAQQFEQLSSLYKELSGIRSTLAETRDAKTGEWRRS